MKRKLLLVVALAFLLLTLLIGVIGCDVTIGGNGGTGGGGIQIHTHNYVDGVCSVCGEKQNAEEVVSKLEYELSEDGTYYIVTGLGEEKGEKITVPAVYNELPVKEIGAFAFCSSMEIEDPRDIMTKITTKIKQVILPDGLEKIGDGAFAMCVYLTEMVIPDSVETVGGYAFTMCINLRSLTIGKNVKSIGGEGEESRYDFAETFKLVEIINKSSISTPHIVLGEDMSLPLNTKKQGRSDIVDKNGFKFYSNNGKHYLIGYDGDEKNITLPESYNGKEYEVFHAAFILSDIESVLFSDKVTSIGMGAFGFCNNLKTVTLGDGVTTIGDGAFSACANLESIDIPDSVTTLDSSMFEGCYKLYNRYDNADYVGTKDNPYLILMQAKNTSITSCVIHDNTKFIADSAFANCSALTTVTIPDSITSIGYYAFKDCTELKGVYISDMAAWCNIDFEGDLTPGTNPLYYAHNLYLNDVLVTDLVIPNTVTEIKSSAFTGAACITTVTIPDSVTSIGNFLFMECKNLERIDFNGTKAQWDAIHKGRYLPEGNGAQFTIYCTDGEVFEYCDHY